MESKEFEKAELVNFNPEKALTLLAKILAAQEGVKISVKVEEKQLA